MLKLKSFIFIVSCLLCCFSVNVFATTATNETTGEYIQGSAITASVKAKLLADSDIKSFDISVATVNGVVTLKGTVDTKDQMKKAEMLAKEVKGVKKVDNQLQIKI
jgi:osmotically-inducible protein OsmY